MNTVVDSSERQIIHFMVERLSEYVFRRALPLKCVLENGAKGPTVDLKEF